MTLLEVREVREFGVLTEATPDILGRQKVSHRSASIAAHVDESTSTPGRQGGEPAARGPIADLPDNLQPRTRQPYAFLSDVPDCPLGENGAIPRPLPPDGHGGVRGLGIVLVLVAEVELGEGGVAAMLLEPHRALQRLAEHERVAVELQGYQQKGRERAAPAPRLLFAGGELCERAARPSATRVPSENTTGARNGAQVPQERQHRALAGRALTLHLQAVRDSRCDRTRAVFPAARFVRERQRRRPTVAGIEAAASLWKESGQPVVARAVGHRLRLHARSIGLAVSRCLARPVSRRCPGLAKPREAPAF